MGKNRAPLNRTLQLSDEDRERFRKCLVKLNSNIPVNETINKFFTQDFFECIDFLPNNFVDLLFVDPPYNLNKKFNGIDFKEMSFDDYLNWIETILQKIKNKLKPTASIYFCSDWKSSSAVHIALSRHFNVLNRITWEREKGRGAKKNWKNNTEDIWFATVSKQYTFNVGKVKLKKRIIAPYKDENGRPKDWRIESQGKFRLTHPSNIWTDISIPFWSMPENTEHPTQKPEKLLAKLLLASTNEGDVVFDPFAGSGTTLVVAKKLKRNFVGIEIDEYFSMLALKRLELAESDKSIQGFDGEYFYERNSFPNMKRNKDKLV